MPADLTDDQLDAAPVLDSIDTLLIEELSKDEDDAFAAALETTAAELRHACRQAGHALHEPVHANDLWIASSAVHIGAPLLTTDAVFDGVPGLTLHR